MNDALGGTVRRAFTAVRICREAPVHMQRRLQTQPYSKARYNVRHPQLFCYRILIFL